MKCPNCGREYRTVIDECSGCGLILAKWRAGSSQPAPAEKKPSDPAAARRYEGWAWAGVALLAGAMLWSMYGPDREAPRPQAASGSGAPASLEDSSYDAFASGAGTALVMFYSNSCGICRAAMPAMRRLAEESGGRYRIALVDVDSNPDLRSRYGIRGVPVFLFFKDGKEVYKAPGAPGYDTESIYNGIREVLSAITGGKQHEELEEG